MQELTDFIGKHGWVLETFAIVLATAVLRLVAKMFVTRLANKAALSNNLYDDALIDSIRRPLGVGIWVVGISFAAQSVGGGADQAEVFIHVETFRDVAVVWVLIWFALRFVKFVEEHIAERGYRTQPVDPTTARAVGKLVRAATIITGVLLVLQAFGISISGVLAFGGIGGIAIGFAARDLLANFFGALMLFLDRPFSVGDWVRSPDREIEGTVEEIGWRLTVIRTFDKRPLYIPNSTFASLTVENPSRMQNRRIYETVGIRYDDIHLMAGIVAEVESMLKNHEAIDTDQTLMVNFVEFGASSVDFFLYCFTKTTVWTEFHAIKQDVLLQVAAIIERQGGEIAFPTRTLHIEADPNSGLPNDS